MTTPDVPDVMEAAPPRLTTTEAAEMAQRLYGVVGHTEPLVSERDQNVRITADDGGAWVLKVSNPAEDPGVVEMEVAAVEHVLALEPALPLPRARPSLAGATVARAPIGGVEHLVRLLPLLPGRHATPGELDAISVRGIGEMVGRIGIALRGFFHPAAGRVIAWDQQHLPRLFDYAKLVENPRRRELLDRVIDRFAERVVPALPRLRSQVIHNDLTLDNLLLDESGAVSGVIDFGDMAHTVLVLDIPAALQSLVRDREDIFEVADAFLAGSTSVLPLEPMEADLLGDLLAGRMAQTVLISAVRTRRYPDNAYIRGWSEPAWALLEQLEAVGFDAAGRRLAAIALQPNHSRRSQPGVDLAARRRVLGSALEPLSYRRPLHLVRGHGAWLEDAGGRRYLDAYNNVPVVGHAHPRVVDAIARQSATLNTNTRYLHDNVVELAERLTATMPDELDTVMFVNSGSEANDLAWRIATTVTGGDAGLVTDWAYHGVTSRIADFSPSEWHDGVQPDGVATFLAPNTYRAPPTDGADALRAAVSRLTDRGRRPAALFIDSLFTADGIFTPEPAVVRAMVAAARDAGALWIADEVQSGHGRTGTGLWGFPAWGIVPDFVTLGKPMGNGYPVAAVVTRSELVDRFAKTTTFFSTFGGNPVACAAALAVLDVIEDEDLVARAAATGEHLRTALTALGDRHPAIGDVRGRGLIAGVELVSDRATQEPDRDLARWVRDEMAERGVLIGTTGRHGNVLKVRPPLAITADEAEIVVRRLDEVLTDLAR